MQHSSTANSEAAFLRDAEVIKHEIYSNLMDEIVLGVCFEVHRASKLGFLFLDESNVDEERKYSIVDEKGYDIFGQASVQMKKQYECVCPNCQRTLAAQRFAPHLEKCMGMGRNSSRIASKRIANVTGKSGGDSDVEDCDNIADTDWNYNNDTKKSKKKKDRNGNASSNIFFKKTTKSVHKSACFNGSPNEPVLSQSASSESSNGFHFDSLSFSEKKAMLSQICGVISEHTKKMCTRTLRCPQHTDEQRRTVRLQMLSSLSEPSVSTDSSTENGVIEDVESGNEVMRDSVYNVFTTNVDSMDSSSDTSSNSEFFGDQCNYCKIRLTLC
ncbi:ataxin-7-like protein 3 isoform X1 [Leptotrombidium deliense]|uniref:SAGA-associated factor 11 homolog n=1 Tax=Leptotrombidium deliense TaxID=299467 RepID=A0A443STV6_9ACAR|nr:ataxin-7-like protein 3 isoform X1 [Leptotrombidium deliense]